MCPIAATRPAPTHQAPPATVARPPGDLPRAPAEPCSADGLRVSEERYWKDYYLGSDKERRGSERDTRVKKAEYAAGGVPEYYILHREPERQAFFVRTAAGVYVPILPEDGVLRSRVLPGLQFRLADLCAQPAPEVLRDDPVYAAFVLPGWREAEQRAAAADLARQEAEQALAELRAQIAGQPLQR